MTTVITGGTTPDPLRDRPAADPASYATGAVVTVDDGRSLGPAMHEAAPEAR